MTIWEIVCARRFGLSVGNVSADSFYKMPIKLGRRADGRFARQIFCACCEVLTVNGVIAHERGCPDAWMDVTKECKWCDSEFNPKTRDQTFCTASCERSFYGR
jgi:hypothetical protein